jgi:NADPH:quinone reductase-like Zn-dependent oxidoreductase
MKNKDPVMSLELRSKLSPKGQIELSLQQTSMGRPAAYEIIVRVDAAPVNPSDLGMLLGPADPSKATVEGAGENKQLLIPLLPAHVNALARRVNLSLCPGLESAGTVIAAGSDCEHLLGKTVAMFGGEMFAQYRKTRPSECMVFPEGTSPAKCAAAFVNPLTALCMLESLRSEGHKAMVHTAAASNLGQMLVKLCNEEDVDLINVVRREEQAEILRAIDARYICDSTSPNFVAELTEMLRETGATLAFDAIGGGNMASTIIQAMENVYAPEEYYIYGSRVHKQMYVYGVLDASPIQIFRGAGNAWSVSGFLMMNYLAKLEPETVLKMKERIVSQIDSNFSSHYTAEISFGDMLDITTLTAIASRSTGAKYLLCPNKMT